jgi:plastocyanin
MRPLPLRPSLARLVLALGALCAVLAVAACGTAAPTPPPTYPPGAIVVTADDLTFDTSELVLPADRAFDLVVVNKESDQHNIAIRTQRGFDGDLIFRHDPISARTVVLRVEAIAAGTYFFICEIHPVMTGTVIVR